MRLSFPKVNPKSLPCDWPSTALVICRPDSLPDLQYDEEALRVTRPAHTPRGTCSLEEGPLGATSEAAGHQRERVTRAGHSGEGGLFRALGDRRRQLERGDSLSAGRGHVWRCSLE